MAFLSKEPEVFCKECRIHFPSLAAYTAHHKRKMKEGNGHIHCEDCGQEFFRRETLARHHKQEHAHEQDLDCPGCGLHFTRLGGLMAHIESNSCLRIGKGEIIDGRAERSSMGRKLAILDGKDPKEYYGRYLPVGDSAVAGPCSALGVNPGLLGHMIQDDVPDYAASSMINVRGKHEGSTVSEKTERLGSQRGHGPDCRPRSMLAAEFPTPSESGAYKKQTGTQGHKASLPDVHKAKGQASEGSSLRSPAQSTRVQPTPVPVSRPGSLVDAEFPTLAKATASKKHAGSQGGKPGSPDYAVKGVPEIQSLPYAVNAQHTSVADTRPGSLVATESPKSAEAGIFKEHMNREVNKDSSTAGEKAKEEASVSMMKTLADSIWAPKTTTVVSSRPSYSRGADLLGDDTPKLDVKFGQASNINLRPNKSEAIRASLQEHHRQKGISTIQSQFSGFQPLSIQDASVKTTEASGTSSSGLHKSATSDTKTSIPPHLRSKISRTGIVDLSQASKPPVDDQRIRCPSSYMHDDSDTGLATACAEIRKEEEDADTVQRSDHGTIRSPITSPETNSDLPPHLRGKFQEISVCPEEECTKNTTSVSEVMLKPRGAHEYAAAASVAGTYTSAIPASDMPTGQSMDGVDSDSEFDATEPLHAQYGSRATKGNLSLPPHLRGKLTHPISVPENVVESENNPSPSVSVGHSAVEPAGSGNQPVTQLRDNFGVAPTIKNYATVAKSSENVPPHLRQRKGEHSVLAAGQGMAVTPPHQMDQVSTEGRSRSLDVRNVTAEVVDPGTRAIVRMRDDDEDTGVGCHDPEHARYNPETYYCRFTKKYQCPISTCAKLFKSAQAISGHLGSDAHKRPLMNLQCPHCLKYFKSTAALTQHAESQGRRCVIRDTSEYRPFVDQLTGGIADLQGVYDDMTNRYVVTDVAIRRYGDEDSQERAMWALEQQRMREIGEKEGSGHWAGKAIEW